MSSWFVGVLLEVVQQGLFGGVLALSGFVSWVFLVDDVGFSASADDLCSG